MRRRGSSKAFSWALSKRASNWKRSETIVEKKTSKAEDYLISLTFFDMPFLCLHYLEFSTTTLLPQETNNRRPESRSESLKIVPKGSNRSQVLPETEPELPDFETMLKPSRFAQQDTGTWLSWLTSNLKLPNLTI